MKLSVCSAITVGWVWLVCLVSTGVAGCVLERRPLLDRDGDGLVGSADCNDEDPAVGLLYPDQDGDGWGTQPEAGGCPAGSAAVAARGGDCDDTQPFVNPGEAEVCNGRDDTCNGQIDEGLPAETWYLDRDRDGYGSDDSEVVACEKPSGTVAVGGDCDDQDALSAPGNVEVCDGRDNDCSGTIDQDAEDASLYYPDRDDDGYGDAQSGSVAVCEGTQGVSENALDCNDASAGIYPGAPELCDGVDQDCDQVIDDNPSVGASFYLDMDQDGFGTSATVEVGCPSDPPAGYSDTYGDCNDQNATIYPGAAELCDGKDQDCDGEVDEALGATTWYQDADLDGFGVSDVTLVECAKPAGYVQTPGDCDDTRAAVFPGAPELCDGQDQSCDGLVDEGFPDSDASGTPDCAEVAIVISQGFRDYGAVEADCYGMTHMAAELSRFEEFLLELGLRPIFFFDSNERGTAPELLRPYGMVFYDDGGWTDLISETTLNGFLDLRLEGKPLLFIGDDLANQAQVYTNSHGDARTFFYLLWLSRLSTSGAPGRSAVVNDSSHPIMRGPYGTVGAFDYYGDMDVSTALGAQESVLMVLNGSTNPAVLAAEDVGQRTVVMLPGLVASASSCPVSNDSGLRALEVLFKNAVTWLRESIQEPPAAKTFALDHACASGGHCKEDMW